jgi:hypothetical protein
MRIKGGSHMDSLQDALQAILSQPTPDALVTLQGALLASGIQDRAVEQAIKIANHFFAYLSELQSKITARQYSELASKLDIGAVGAVALENILSGSKEDFWQNLVLGGLAEGLMVAASRQYIKGWDAETGLVHAQATWYLTEALWHASTEMQPDLSLEQRWRTIQGLLAPAHDANVPTRDKAVLLGRIFQVLLLAHLIPLLPASRTSAT